MNFSFQKFVHKSTRGLFAFIVVIMVVPLVLWGYMGKSGMEKEEDKGDAGVLYGTIHISKGEFNRHLGTAPASWWGKKYDEPMTLMLMRYGRMPEPPKTADLQKQAWEDIILLREAKANGIDATEHESLVEMREIFQRFAPRAEYSDEIMNRIATDLFHVSFSSFQAWIHEHVMIEKLLNLISNSEFADYDKVYDRLMTGHQMARVWYASFDPKDYLKDVKTPTTDEIAGYYQKNKEKFKVPGKVLVSYLMADAEELKKKEPEPSEAEIKKYYDDNMKIEFAKPHEHHPGEEHKPDEKPEYKSFDEVKGEIPNKIKQKAADLKAAEIMAKVDVALGAAATANNNKYPDDVFDQLKKQFEKDKIDLVHDITTSFDPKQVEDVEKTVGSGSNLGTWAFDGNTKVGDVSQKVRTGKGVVLFRLQKKIDALDPGITERIRESIVKELQKEQVKKKTQLAANNVVQEITTHGMISARMKHPLDWRLTRYFKVGGGDTGIDDAQLGQAIGRQVGQLKPGKATMLPGTNIQNKDKADWAYVVYLEDLADVPPEDASAQFTGQRRGLDEEAKKRYRDVFIQDTVNSARVELDPSMKKTDAAPTDSAPNP
ncbi:MAG: hypothetical protein HY293_09795 [Planctomycetes bacterium]|nr:hypothetical protein [Planctomycetota bacterium]